MAAVKRTRPQAAADCGQVSSMSSSVLLLCFQQFNKAEDKVCDLSLPVGSILLQEIPHQLLSAAKHKQHEREGHKRLEHVGYCL